MIKIAFEKPLTALEIRDPAVEACRQAAGGFGLNAKFLQYQQPAFDGFPTRAKRNRIGNGKHNNWHIDLQPEELSASRVTVLGRLVIKGPIVPEHRQFGGFDYGKYGEPKPTYTHISVIGQTASEFLHYKPKDVDPAIFEVAYQAIRACFAQNQEQFFDPAEYLIN